MYFETERFINRVFEACYAVWTEKQKFDAGDVIDKLALPKAPDNDGDYWQKKNVTNSLNVLERARFISGQVQPEYTKNFRLLVEKRHGQITTLGKILKHLPPIIRCFIIFLYLQKQRILAILGTLSFVKLAHNAYIGAGLLTGWIEQIAALVVLYIIYLLIRKIID